MSNDDDDRVGYGRPPRQHRFKKGQSGNRKGRPKGARNLATIAREVLGSSVDVTVNGKVRRMSALEATVHRTKIDALRGNKAATDRMLELAKRFMPEEDSAPSPAGDFSHLSLRELQIIKILRSTIANDDLKLAANRKEYLEHYGDQAAFWLDR